MPQIKSILTVTLNPAIDKVAKISHFRSGFDNSVSQVDMMAGGKGINVSRTIKYLGQNTLAMGFAGGANGQNLLRNLLLEGIEHHFVFIQGETRVNLSVCDNKTGRLTRILEPGPAIESKDIASFRNKFCRLAGQSDWVVLSGRGIPGMPKDFFGELTVAARKLRAKIIVDAAGEDLRRSLKGRPFLVKPNLREAEDFFKQKLRDKRRQRAALIELLRLGASQSIITMGPEGAVGTDGKEFFWVKGPAIKSGYPVGSGDAFCGGLVTALAQKSRFQDALAFAAAAGAVNVLSPLPGALNRKELGACLHQVKVKIFSP